MGDLVFVLKNNRMMNGVHRNEPIVIDTEDKITTLAEEDTSDNKVAVILRDKSNMIGEVANVSTALHNKTPFNPDVAKQYQSYVCLLSIISNKVIDSSKTGVVYMIPKYIAKQGQPLPYFMKYRSDYYAAKKKLNKGNSNMNRLCKEIERWRKTVQFKSMFKDLSANIMDFDSLYAAARPSSFDYTIMTDSTIPHNQLVYGQVETLFLDYCKESAKLSKIYRAQIGEQAKKKRTEEFVEEVNWDAFYISYRKKFFEICPDVCELANYLVKLTYEDYPNKPAKCLWVCGVEGVLSNLKQVQHYLPMRDPNGEYEYLGKKYRMERITD